MLESEKEGAIVYLAGGRRDDDTVHFEAASPLTRFLLQVTQFDLLLGARRTSHWGRLAFQIRSVDFRCRHRRSITHRAETT